MVTDTVRFVTAPERVGSVEPPPPLGPVGLSPPLHPGSAVPTASTDIAWQACTQKSRRFTDLLLRTAQGAIRVHALRDGRLVYAPRAMAASRSLASRAFNCWL